MESTDVLVIGSGIAGLCAAIEAACTGAAVTVASAGKTMSGSSFFPGTWGLGLIGPVDEDDEQDLIGTIQTVGGGVADLELVQTFVHGIPRQLNGSSKTWALSSSVRKALRALSKSSLSPALTTKRACGAASPASPLRTL